MLIPNFAFIYFSYEYLLLLLHKVNKLAEIKNEPRNLLPNVNKGKQVCCFRISHLKIYHMNICCCCLHKVNKLVEINNGLGDLLTNVTPLYKNEKCLKCPPCYCIFFRKMCPVNFSPTKIQNDVIGPLLETGGCVRYLYFCSCWGSSELSPHSSLTTESNMPESIMAPVQLSSERFSNRANSSPVSPPSQQLI